MAERGIEVVAPEQTDHPAAEPDAFRIAGRAADLGGGFGELIGPALRILGRIAGLAGLRRLVAGLGVAGLCASAATEPTATTPQQVQRAEHARRRDMTAPVFMVRWISRLTFDVSGQRMGQHCDVRRSIQTLRRDCRTARLLSSGDASTCLKCRTLAAFPAAAKPDSRSVGPVADAQSCQSVHARGGGHRRAPGGGWARRSRCRLRRSIRARSSTACPMRRSAASRPRSTSRPGSSPGRSRRTSPSWPS